MDQGTVFYSCHPRYGLWRSTQFVYGCNDKEKEKVVDEYKQMREPLRCWPNRSSSYSQPSCYSKSHGQMHKNNWYFFVQSQIHHTIRNSTMVRVAPLPQFDSHTWPRYLLPCGLFIIMTTTPISDTTGLQMYILIYSFITSRNQIHLSYTHRSFGGMSRYIFQFYI